MQLQLSPAPFGSNLRFKCQPGGCLRLCLAALIVSPCVPGRAAVVEAWVHRAQVVFFNSPEHGFKVASDPSGNIVASGSIDDGRSGQDMLTIKYSKADGAV